jgi:hypothetical protein
LFQRRSRREIFLILKGKRPETVVRQATWMQSQRAARRRHESLKWWDSAPDDVAEQRTGREAASPSRLLGRVIHGARPTPFPGVVDPLIPASHTAPPPAPSPDTDTTGRRGFAKRRIVVGSGRPAPAHLRGVANLIMDRIYHAAEAAICIRLGQECCLRRKRIGLGKIPSRTDNQDRRRPALANEGPPGGHSSATNARASLRR